MTLFGELRARAQSGSEPLTAGNWPGSSVLFGGAGVKTSSGLTVTERTALGMSPVWRAITVSSAVPASLPFGPYVADGSSRVEATGHAATLMAEPHPDMVRFELWQLVFLHRRLWGNAYLRVLRNRLGQISELWPIYPSRVKAGRDSKTGVKVYVIDGDLNTVYGDVWNTDDMPEILHIPGMGYDGVCGVSPVRAACQAIGLGMAAEEFGAKLFGSGSLATGILQTEQRLTQPQADQLAQRWREKRTGLGSAHETIVLDKGATWKQLTIPPEDAQFLESRKFQINEVCRFFGLPPFMMFDTEKSTSWGTGLEQQMIGWVTIDLRPDLIAVEQRVTRILKPEKVYAHFAIEGLLRGDSVARAAFYTSLWNLGVFSTNDIRALEEMGPVEGGDVRYRPLNMGRLGEVDEPGTQPAGPGGPSGAPIPVLPGPAPAPAQ